MSDLIATKLDEARALIERGWCRKKFQKGGCFCALGALGQVYAGDPADGWLNDNAQAAYHLLQDAIGTSLITDWNDEQTSKKPVVEAFRKAAELARATA